MSFLTTHISRQSRNLSRHPSIPIHRLLQTSSSITNTNHNNTNNNTSTHSNHNNNDEEEKDTSWMEQHEKHTLLNDLLSHTNLPSQAAADTDDGEFNEKDIVTKFVQCNYPKSDKFQNVMQDYVALPYRRDNFTPPAAAPNNNYSKISKNLNLNMDEGDTQLDVNGIESINESELHDAISHKLLQIYTNHTVHIRDILMLLYAALKFPYKAYASNIHALWTDFRDLGLVSGHANKLEVEFLLLLNFYNQGNVEEAVKVCHRILPVLVSNESESERVWNRWTYHLVLSVLKESYEVDRSSCQSLLELLAVVTPRHVSKRSLLDLFRLYCSGGCKNDENGDVLGKLPGIQDCLDFCEFSDVPASWHVLLDVIASARISSEDKTEVYTNILLNYDHAKSHGKSRVFRERLLLQSFRTASKCKNEKLAYHLYELIVQEYRDFSISKTAEFESIFFSAITICDMHVAARLLKTLWRKEQHYLLSYVSNPQPDTYHYPVNEKEEQMMNDNEIDCADDIKKEIVWKPSSIPPRLKTKFSHYSALFDLLLIDNEKTTASNENVLLAAHILSSYPPSSTSLFVNYSDDDNNGIQSNQFVSSLFNRVIISLTAHKEFTHILRLYNESIRPRNNDKISLEYMSLFGIAIAGLNNSDNTRYITGSDKKDFLLDLIRYAVEENNIMNMKHDGDVQMKSLRGAREFLEISMNVVLEEQEEDIRRDVYNRFDSMKESKNPEDWNHMMNHLIMNRI